MVGYLLLIPVLLPVAGGIALGCFKFSERKKMCVYVFTVLALSLLFSVGIFVYAATASDVVFEWKLFSMAEGMDIYFRVDTLGKFFILLEESMWLLAALSAFEYMSHEKNERRFFLFFLIAEGMLTGLGLSGNLLTYYLFFECMTLISAPLVLHSLRSEAVEAGLKYLFYSIGGALFVLFGFFFFAGQGIPLTFMAGGILQETPRTPMALFAVFLMILGFGTKAGLFPMHGWLPAAHPVAPAPASAVLSGVITKAGVLGIIRCIYYIVGIDFIRGTWVQYLWMGLSLFTVLMGSMLAYREKGFKKRLAYSTVSQVSYILFGLSALSPIAFIGALLHMAFHSIAKDGLFLCAGAVICKTGRTMVTELKGIGKDMPGIMWCFLFASVTLIGIPPTSAFVSKWYLASGSIASGIPVFWWLGPVILLISAILTAGYLLPIVINGFLPGKDFIMETGEKKDPTWLMILPVVLLTFSAVLLGVFPGGIIKSFTEIAGAVF